MEIPAFMRIADVIRNMWHLLKQIPTVIQAVLIIIIFLITALGWIKEVFVGIPELAKDLFYRHWKKQDYRAKTTVMKVMIDDDATQMIKVRTIRALKELATLELDYVPTTLGPGPAALERLVKITKYFSVPGTAHKEVQAKNRVRFLINFGEKLHLHPGRLGGLLGGKDYSLVLSYTMQESRAVLFDPPFVGAFQPVGSDRLVIEVQFPPTWKLADGKTPEVWTVSPEGKELNKLQSPRTTIEYHPDVADVDSRGPTDYILASITNPPQGDAVRLKWAWEQRP